MSAKRLNLPDSASVAIPDAAGKLHAPSAARNGAALLQTIAKYVPARGNALEIASGTGEHIIRYARAFPNISWQPTDIDQDRLDSIKAWSVEANLPNINLPKLLDASVAGWAANNIGQDLIILSNLLHLISEAEARVVVTQSAKALNSGGVSLIYGPFLRGLDFASDGDRKFHESLNSEDPEIGYKSYQAIQIMQEKCGLAILEPIEMPANNLFLVAQKI